MVQWFMILEAQWKKLVEKYAPFEKDGIMKRNFANDLGHFLIDKRADAYKRGEGRDNSGSTSTVGDTDSDLEDDRE